MEQDKKSDKKRDFIIKIIVVQVLNYLIDRFSKKDKKSQDKQK